jgi:hypothetical protein
MRTSRQFKNRGNATTSGRAAYCAKSNLSARAGKAKAHVVIERIPAHRCLTLEKCMPHCDKGVAFPIRPTNDEAPSASLLAVMVYNHIA